jgi:hypothetical protein
MAERQVWLIVADHSTGFNGPDAGQRSGEIVKGLQSHAANDQN